MNVSLGAWPTSEGVGFRVWAPDHEHVDYLIHGDGAEPRRVAARPSAAGYFTLEVPGLGDGALYAISLDGGRPLPDPASRAQPRGVHGPSCVVDPRFEWTDSAWSGRPIEDMLIEEVHVGAATREGTFDALSEKLGHYEALGVTAIELMPVAAFPGHHGWGYDGVCLFAPHSPYGGATGLRRLVDAAHAHRLSVLLDVVYNHLGPDGNYLKQYASAYFTDRHETPWGEAVNFDGPGSAEVRRFFLENVRMWIEDYHLDGLRLDATHMIFDSSEPSILEEIGERARDVAPHRAVVTIAEDDRNSASLVRPVSAGGMGLDGVWADDFHHSLCRGLAGDSGGYFRDYQGTVEELVTILRRGWLYEGQWSVHHGAPRGTSAQGIPSPRLIHCIQNHDQIGNRGLGDRLSSRVDAATYRAMSALLLMSPFTPLMFMGQEWAANEPFCYFTDHEPALGRLVSEGRRREFASFETFSGSSVVDPQSAAAFMGSKLAWSELGSPQGAHVLAWYKALLALRRAHPAFRGENRSGYAVAALGEDGIDLDYDGGAERLRLLVTFGRTSPLSFTIPNGLRITLSSDDLQFGGNLAGPLTNDGADRIEMRGPAAFILTRDDYSAAIASS